MTKSGARSILLLSPSSRLLGARRSLLQLACNLDPERYRPVVVSKPEGDLVDALRAAGIAFHPLFMGPWRKGLHFFARPFRIAHLARIARDEGAVLVHSNEFHSNPYGVRAARKAGHLPTVCHMRLSITPRQIRNYDLRRADRVICVSRDGARFFQEAWPDWNDRVEVVYNGVDLREFHATESRREARMRFRLGPEHFVIGQFGLVSPRKRIHLLLNAAALLKEGHLGNVQPRLLIVGSPGKSDLEYEQSLRRLVVDKGLQEIARFIPFTPDVADIYRACDVNVLVSNEEGFGRTIIEAGAMGIPSVGARVGGIPEIIEDGETGLLVPEDDDGTALADRLRLLISHPARRAEMGEAARRRVADLFSIEKHAERIMAIYDRLLERKG